MKKFNPIRALVQVRPVINQGRSVQRPKIFSQPTKAIVFGFGFLLLFGLVGLVGTLQAQQLKPDKVASKENAKSLPNDSSSSNVPREESSLVKWIALLPIRLGRSVANALFPRKKSSDSSSNINPNDRQPFSGRIVAYRLLDRISQLPSFAPNKEVFLFKVNTDQGTGESRIVKIEYEHFGITNISQAILEAAPLLTLKAKREKNCDQTYDQFLSTAPKLKQGGSDDVLIGGVEFVENFKDLNIAPERILPCYALEKGDFRETGHREEKLRDGSKKSEQQQRVPADFVYPSSQETLQIDAVIKSKSLSGIVTDPNGAPLPKVLVERVNKNWGERIEAILTDSEGQFVFEPSRAGIHFVRLSKPGFTPMLLRVNVNQKARANLSIVLPLGH
jgi:hypothetical protein